MGDARGRCLTPLPCTDAMAATNIPPPDAPLDGVEHSAAAYKSGRCRCALCREEWATAQRNYRRSRGAKPKEERKLQKDNHGTRSRYKSGCRCEDCRAANRQYARERYRASKQ